jgi:hypothetical protein
MPMLNCFISQESYNRLLFSIKKWHLDKTPDDAASILLEDAILQMTKDFKFEEDQDGTKGSSTG